MDGEVSGTAWETGPGWGGDVNVYVPVHRDTVRSWGFPPGSRILEETCIFLPFT